MSSLDVRNNPRESGQLLMGKLRRYSRLQQPQPHQLTTSHVPIKASPVSAPPSPAMGAAGCVLRGAVLVTDTQPDRVPTLGSSLLISGRIRAEVWGRTPRAKGRLKEEEFGPCTQSPPQYPSRQQGGWPSSQSCLRRFSGVITAVAQILVGHQKIFFKK